MYHEFNGWCRHTKKWVSVISIHLFFYFIPINLIPSKAPKFREYKYIFQSCTEKYLCDRKKKYIVIHWNTKLQSEVNYLFLFNYIYLTNCTQNIRSSIFNTMLVLMSLIKQYKELLHLNAHNLPAFFVYINTLVFSLCMCLSLSFTHFLRSRKRLFVPFSLNFLRSSCSFYFCCKWTHKIRQKEFKRL